MKKSDLISLIEECINEVINPFYPTLDQALTAVEQFIENNKIVVDPAEHEPELTTDRFGIRAAFKFGGISYEQSREAHYKLLSYKGKPTRKYLHVTIYRMPSGNYELTMYVN